MLISENDGFGWTIISESNSLFIEEGYRLFDIARRLTEICSLWSSNKLMLYIHRV